MQFSSVEILIESIRHGEMIILVDDENRENEGDLIVAGEKITAEHVRFMAREACGLICLSLCSDQCHRLDLNTIPPSKAALRTTAFTHSIEAATGVSTGISVKDRAHTILTASLPDAKADDIVQPGHLFPLKARDGGVLARAGHTEASVDLVRIAGFHPAAAIVEIMNEDGTMARRDQLKLFSAKHQIKMGAIADLIRYRLKSEKVIARMYERNVNTLYGPFSVVNYRDVAGCTHIALVANQRKNDAGNFAIGRQHSGVMMSCVHQLKLCADLFSINLPTEDSLPIMMNAMAEVGTGVIVLPHVEAATESGMVRNFIESDGQGYEQSICRQWTRAGISAQILKDLGVCRTKLIRQTNLPLDAWTDQGIQID